MEGDGLRVDAASSAPAALAASDESPALLAPANEEAVCTISTGPKVLSSSCEVAVLASDGVLPLPKPAPAFADALGFGGGCWRGG